MSSSLCVTASRSGTTSNTGVGVKQNPRPPEIEWPSAAQDGLASFAGTCPIPAVRQS